MSMRPFLCAVTALLVLVPAVAAQPYDWSLVQSSPFHSYRFEDGSFLSPQHGWIVNGAGETHRTTDGGATWQLRSVENAYLRSAAFVSETKGWVGALYGPSQLFETTDGAATLTDVTDRIEPSIGGGICGLWAVDANTAFGVGQWNGPAYFIKTTDGGATWQSTDLSAQAGSLIDVYFFDANRGIAVGGTAATSPGGRAVVLGTEDGGATWTQRFVSSGTGTSTEWAWKISFPTPDVGYVSVEYGGATATGKVLKTTDGGQTWTELAVPGGRSMQGVGFVTALDGWTSGRGTTMRTGDGGLSWTATSQMDGQVNRFAFFGDSLGFAMGQRIYRLEPRAVANEPDAEPSGAALVSMAPNPVRSAATITYRLAESSRVDLAVFDVRGRRAATLAQGMKAAGLHHVVWESDERAAGVYLVRLRVGSEVFTQTLVHAGR